MSTGDGETLAYYSREAQAYADTVAGEADNPHLARFAGMLPPGGAVLDFGCGPGWAADRFRTLGFHVRAMDGSAGLAEEGRRRYGLEIEVCQFDALHEEAAFDGVWASFSLLHDTRAAMPGHLARIHRALRSGGAFYLGLKEGRGEKRDSLNRRYTYYQLAEVETLLGTAGFSLLGHEKESALGMDGVPAVGLHVFARRV